MRALAAAARTALPQTVRCSGNRSHRASFLLSCSESMCWRILITGCVCVRAGIFTATQLRNSIRAASQKPISLLRLPKEVGTVAS